VAVIVVAVIALVTYALTDPPATQRAAERTVVPPGVMAQLAGVPPAVFDAVGADPGDTPLAAPTLLAGQPPLRSGGMPEVLFIGAENCPFCAAERWPLVVALSRFGHFTGLKDMQSAPQSVFPGTQTFSFVGSTYTSRYVAFTGIELYSDEIGAQGSFTRIATLTPTQAQTLSRYGGDSGTPSASGIYPFVDIGNRMVSSTSAFSPAVLVRQSQSAIAGGLSQADQPDQPASRAVVASANQLTAGICAVTGQQPAPVCASRGVRDAASALGMD
jgi:hypothetical protein